VVVNVLDFGMDIQAAVDAPRMHHQWFPDKLRVEPVLVKKNQEAIRQLMLMGHQIDQGRQGDAHSIWIDPKTRQPMGAADRRISGKVSIQ
jgi:gamma-glutamyltranspeptidase / glutathione hydrolase